MAKRIVIASGKGGVGKTTVAIGLSKALVARDKKVLLVDFDNLRSVDLMLGAAENVVFDWGDAVLGRCTASEAIGTAQGISFLACPPRYDDLTPQKVKRLMKELEADYDYLLFDAPAGVGAGLRLACAAAQRAIVVATPDPVCVRAACRAAQEMETMGVANSRLVINRAVRRDIRQKRLLNIDDVIDKTGVQLVAIIPEDKYLRKAGIDNILLSWQLSYEAFCNLAARVEGEQVPLAFL